MSNVEQLNTENIVEEVKDVVTETVPETTPAVETVEEVVNEVTEEKEKKSKSFFDIFKKDKPAEEVTETPVEEVKEEAAAVVADGEEAAAATEAAPEGEVPVDNAPAKKSRLCGLCAFGKKEEAAAPVEGETPAEGETVATEEAAAPAEGEAAPVAEEPVAEESAAPVVAAADAGDEAAAETTEGEAVAPVVEADLVRSGVLFKSGKFFKSNLNERHCRLLSSGAFQWSKTEEFAKAHECMINSETTVVAFMAEGEAAPHKYRFELHCCGSVTTYAADTEEDRDEWIRAIETVKESVTPAATEEVATEAVTEETPAAAAE